MLRAMGLTDDDMTKPQIGVASSWNEVTPCNLPLDRLAKRTKVAVRDAGGVPFEFVTIAVSDGISMGHEGMRASLVSREVIADSVECVMHAESFDAMVTLAGCDKSLPGMLMAAARLDVPSVFLYGGTIMPGELDGKALDITSVFEAVGANAVGAISDEELTAIECAACPGEGSCAGMFTANTMASVGEALGMSLLGSASVPSIDPRRDQYAYDSGLAVLNLLDRGITCATGDDQAGLRERDRGGHGARRFDQRRVAPARHRPRGPRRPRTRRLQQASPPASPTSPT